LLSSDRLARFRVDIAVVVASPSQLIASADVARLADNAPVVAAGSQNKRQVRAGEEMDFVNPVPGSEVVLDRADHEQGYAQVGERCRAAGYLETPFS
jgi:hypothetical protein